MADPSDDEQFVRPVVMGVLLAIAFLALLILILSMLTGLSPAETTAGADARISDSASGTTSGAGEGTGKTRGDGDSSAIQEEDAPPGEADDGPVEVTSENTDQESQSDVSNSASRSDDSGSRRQTTVKGEISPFSIAALPTGGAEVGSADGGSRQGFADVEDRLNRAGARSGAVQISLAWNNRNDLDLHVTTPSGERIMFQRKKSSCGGTLDVDMNAGGNLSSRPVENIYWPEDGAPSGPFVVIVHHYANHGSSDPTRYHVVVQSGGRTRRFEGSVSHGDPPEIVHRFTRP